MPAGPHHDAVLEQIRRLDCADKALAPCDPAAPPPRPGITGFRAAASVQDYRRTLAGTLKSIVFAGDDDSIFILRGISRRLVVTRSEAPALVDFIRSKDCPVSAVLADADKATLLKIKRDAIKEAGQ